MFVIKTATNKNKKEIANFRTENFLQLLDELEKNKPSETYINRFKTQHARYISTLEQQEKIIGLSIEKYQKDAYEQTLLNIIVFNDNYTTK
jgi:hypothetical protein